MKIALASAFRNSTSYLARYFSQVAELSVALAARGDTLHLAMTYGDCTDETAEGWAALAGVSGCACSMVEYSHGMTHLGSIMTPQRMRALSGVGNALLSAVPVDAEALVYVESDLIWRAEALVALLADLDRPEVDLAFPMIFAFETRRRFYDIWAYRIGGRAFDPDWPYHPALELAGPHLYELSGAGSCAAVRAPALAAMRRIGFPAWDVWPGLVKALRQAGYRSWLDPEVTIWHP